MTFSDCEKPQTYQLKLTAKNVDKKLIFGWENFHKCVSDSQP